MLIAIDHGNYAIKTPNFAFLSGLTEHSVKPPLADEIVEYGGKIWTLSSKRINYMRDKTEDDSFFILSLFAIAKEIEHSGIITTGIIPIDLCVGLPPEHYGGQKEKFAAYFKHRPVINFRYNGKTLHIQIRTVEVFPQAYAAIINKIPEIKTNPRTFIVDIGGFTTDVLLLDGEARLDTRYCRSFESGILVLFNKIRTAVNSKLEYKLEDSQIEAVLLGKNNLLPDEMRNIITVTTVNYTNEILKEFRENDIDLRYDAVIFIGGGSLLLKDFLSENPLIAKSIFIEDRKANAIGYYALGKAKFGFENAQSK